MADQTRYGSFVGTTDVYDVSNIESLDVNSPEFKLFLVRLRQSVNNLALVLNTKDSGYYPLTEFVNGQLFFPNPAYTSQTSKSPIYRQVYRTVVNCGTLPNTGTINVAHGINFPVNNTTTATRIYGTASDLTAPLYIPLPFASPTAANNIEVTVDNVNVNITTGNNRTNFTTSYVVIEYIKE